MNKRIQIMLLVNEQAEKFYPHSEKLGQLAAQTFLEEIHYRGQRGLSDTETRILHRHRAQLTGLENIAETTLKVADVLDYIKKQIARPDRKGWREEYQGKRFGESLKQMIENDLKSYVDILCSQLHIGKATDQDWRERQHIYLQLIRQLVRQIVVHYEYCVSDKEEESRNDQRTRTGTHQAAQR